MQHATAAAQGSVSLGALRARSASSAQRPQEGQTETTNETLPRCTEIAWQAVQQGTSALASHGKYFAQIASSKPVQYARSFAGTVCQKGVAAWNVFQTQFPAAAHKVQSFAVNADVYIGTKLVNLKEKAAAAADTPTGKYVCDTSTRLASQVANSPAAKWASKTANQATAWILPQGQKAIAGTPNADAEKKQG